MGEVQGRAPQRDAVEDEGRLVARHGSALEGPHEGGDEESVPRRALEHPVWMAASSVEHAAAAA